MQTQLYHIYLFECSVCALQSLRRLKPCILFIHFLLSLLLLGPTPGGGMESQQSPGEKQDRLQVYHRTHTVLTPRGNWDIFKYGCLGGRMVKTPHRIKKNLCCGATLLTSATCTLANHVYPNGFCLLFSYCSCSFCKFRCEVEKLTCVGRISFFIFCLSSWVHWLIADWLSVILHLTVGKKKCFPSLPKLLPNLCSQYRF